MRGAPAGGSGGAAATAGSGGVTAGGSLGSAGTPLGVGGLATGGAAGVGGSAAGASGGGAGVGGSATGARGGAGVGGSAAGASGGAAAAGQRRHPCPVPVASARDPQTGHVYVDVEVRCRATFPEQLRRRHPVAADSWLCTPRAPAARSCRPCCSTASRRPTDTSSPRPPRGWRRDNFRVGPHGGRGFVCSATRWPSCASISAESSGPAMAPAGAF